MKISQLTYFCAVCDCGSVSKAAERLYVAQPSVSVAIKELESELGVALFTRYNNRLILTEEGKLFLEKSRQMLRLADEMKVQVKDQRQRLRVMLTPLLGPILITPIIRLFDQLKMRHPQCEFEVFECDSADIPVKLMGNDADIALANLDREPPPGLQKMTLYQAPLKAYMNRDHPLAGEEALSVGQLEGVSLITVSERSPVRSVIEDWFRAHGCTPHFQLRFSQFSTVRTILESGNRENVILSHVKFADSPSIVERPLAERVCVEVGALWLEDKAFSNVTIEFLDQAKGMMQNVRQP